MTTAMTPETTPNATPAAPETKSSVLTRRRKLFALPALLVVGVALVGLFSSRRHLPDGGGLDGGRGHQRPRPAQPHRLPPSPQVVHRSR